MSTTKKIGILTSGGDCAGLNAVIRAVVNSASRLGWEVYGIKNGTDGLTEKPLAYEILTVHNFSDTPWPRISGSYLGSLNKGVKMESLEEVSKRFGEGVKTLGLDAIVVVGGDGSMNIVSNYCKNAGVKMVGIPKTIDNDLCATDHTPGYGSAAKYIAASMQEILRDCAVYTVRRHCPFPLPRPDSGSYGPRCRTPSHALGSGRRRRRLPGSRNSLQD